MNDHQATTGQQVLDALVIGAGPIGLETAWALQRRGLRALCIDQGPIGATIDWWAPGTKFFSSPERISIAGVPLIVSNQDKATREDYLQYLRQVVQTHDLPVRTFLRVTQIERTPTGFRAHTVDARGDEAGSHDSRAIEAAHIVLAIGNMHRPRRLGIPGEDLALVSHYLRDPHHSHARRVLIVGGKNSAVEAAIRLYRAGAEVTISYRRPRFDEKRVKYWLRPELEWLILKSQIGFLPCTTPVRITTEGAELAFTDAHTSDAPWDALLPAVFDHAPGALASASSFPAPLRPGEQRHIPFDDVLLLTGYEQETTLLDQLGVSLEGEARRPVYDKRTMQTNAPGVYIAGTAIDGSPSGGVLVFIENAHIHAQRIAASIAGAALDADDPQYGSMAES